MYGLIEKSVKQTCAAKVVCANEGEGRAISRRDSLKVYNGG